MVSEVAASDPGSVELWYASIDNSNPAYPIVRGRISPQTLKNVQYDTYQREHLTSQKKREGMKAGFRSRSKFPDVDFANRGVEWQIVQNETSETRGLVVELVGTTWCIDGRQRISNALELMNEEDVEPVLGASVMFNSTKEIEMDLFEVLNQDHTKVASQVMLRNRVDQNEGVRMMYDLTAAAEFPLQGRICWKQNAGKSHLITGTSFAKSLCWLHEVREQVPTKSIRDIVSSLGKLHSALGQDTFRENALGFYLFVDRTWGLRNVSEKPKPRPTQVMSAWIPSLARMFASDSAYWNGATFSVPDDKFRRLKDFPMDDAFVRKSAAAGVKPDVDLISILQQHLTGQNVRRVFER